MATEETECSRKVFPCPLSDEDLTDKEILENKLWQRKTVRVEKES